MRMTISAESASVFFNRLRALVNFSTEGDKKCPWQCVKCAFAWRSKISLATPEFLPSILLVPLSKCPKESSILSYW